jgi:anti-sigma factor RsiW
VSNFSAHERAFELLPWYVNGTLSDAEHGDVERHTRNCLPCRVALLEQRHLARLLKEQPTVRLSAEGGFERLLAEIDASRQSARRVPGQRALRLPRPAHFATAAALAASLVLAAWLVTLGGDSRREATFVTATQPGGANAEIDVVFANNVSAADHLALIREINGVAIDGPSDVGRYRVRLTEADADRIDGIIERLRGDARVRFAARAYSTGEQP